MLTAEENETLTRVGAGTPMGRLMRRYWLPACTSEDLEPGGAPHRVRLLGEDLVAFRTGNGVVGLVGERCPHRGASLALARNLDCALQCLYHGWQVAPDGSILDMPAEPEDSTYKEKFRHVAYAVSEAGGVLWAYLGAGTPPPLPNFEWLHLNPSHSLFLRAVVRCNWAQALEGAVDSAHQTYLHDARSRIERDRAHVERIAREGGELTDGFDETGQIIRPWNDGRPRIQVENAEYGFRYAAIRKPMIQEDKLHNVRVTHYVAPVSVIIPGPEGYAQLLAHVPIDDTHTMFWHVRANLVAPYSDEERRIHVAAAGLVPGDGIDAQFNRTASRENNWLQDRDEMRLGDRLSGMHGTVNEDHAVQESMGPIVDRTNEHLGTSDQAVIRFRRLMLEAVSTNEDGGTPVGLGDDVDLSVLRGVERTVPLDRSWQTVAAEAVR
jgi:phthalate 4,5-dioxygenase oxygenase subunit